MYEHGKQYTITSDDEPVTAERDGKEVQIEGSFVCVETGDGYAVLEDARLRDRESGLHGGDASLHRYTVKQ